MGRIKAKMLKMGNNCIWKILAILIVLVTIVSCAAMPSAGNVSESEVTSSSATIYMPEDAGYNTTIRAVVDNVSDGGIIVVYNGTHKENAVVNGTTAGQVPPISALYLGPYNVQRRLQKWESDSSYNKLLYN